MCSILSYAESVSYIIVISWPYFAAKVCVGAKNLDTCFVIAVLDTLVDILPSLTRGDSYG